MLNATQARSTVCLHHVDQLIQTLGETTTLADVRIFMVGRFGPAQQQYDYPCPKCKGKGDYLPEVDGESLPPVITIGGVETAPGDIANADPARITCSICSGEGRTSVQVRPIQQDVQYENTPVIP